MFVSLEDETGSVQVIVWPKVKARLRAPLLRGPQSVASDSEACSGDLRAVQARRRKPHHPSRVPRAW